MKEYIVIWTYGGSERVSFPSDWTTDDIKNQLSAFGVAVSIHAV